jgi:murein DD-endopeptidase MepM/ murein hydrolase activator NlpD
MPMLVLLLISLGLLAPPRASPEWRLSPPRASPEWRLAPSRASYAWPLTPARVVRAFDPPAAPWLSGHRGVDLAAAPGVVVSSSGAGQVVYSGVLAGRGVVSVRHPDGLRTTYEPVTPSVIAGDAVGVGSSLGVLEPGHPGCPVAACLHWGLRRDDLYLDPLALLGLGRVRLLPMAGLPAQARALIPTHADGAAGDKQRAPPRRLAGCVRPASRR